MEATFIELPPFERYWQRYLNDESFREFQKILIKNPEAGDVIEGRDCARYVTPMKNEVKENVADSA